jgi:hypothetical protein
VLHGRARAVAATLASVAARARARNSRLDLTDVGKAVTYLTNNHQSTCGTTRRWLPGGRSPPG